MNTKRMLFIINPCAGQRRVARKLADILQRFCAGGMVPTVLTTEYAGHARKLVQQYAGQHDIVVCAGGDGTLNEILQGTVGHPNAAIGCVPCGSGNDFIKNIGAKKEDFFDFNKLVNGKVRIYDAINVNGHICSNLCNIGIDSIICDRITHFKTLPGISGQMAYNLSTFTTIGAGAFGHMGFPMTITFDDGESISGRYMLSVFGNGKVYGGGWRPVPNAEMDDGFIDFCSIKEVGIIKAGELIGSYKAGKHVGNPKFDGYLTMRRCTSAHVESDVSLTVCVDGEIFKSKSVDIKIIPASLPFLVPAAD